MKINFKNKHHITINLRNYGFTLIELLIVIGVIGVLASALVVLINPIGQLQKARDAKRKADLEQIRAALEQYRTDQGSYPAQNLVNTCGSSLTDGGSTTYLQTIPCDPLAPNAYNKNVVNKGSYLYILTGSTYTLTACLENTTDPLGNNPNPGGGGTGCTNNNYYTIKNP